MSWVNLHDGWARHPKLAGLHRDARLLWVDLLSYCREQLTDGVINENTLFVAAMDCPRNTIRRHMATLVSRGLLDEISPTSPQHLLDISGGSGWVLHDYLDWNESRASVLSARAATRDRVRKYRESKRSHETPEPCNAVTHATSNDVPTQVGNAPVTPPQPNPTQPNNLRPPVMPPEGGTGEAGKKAIKPRLPEVPLDPSWAPSPSHFAKAKELGISATHEATEFREHAERTDRRCRNWDAAFHTWLRKTVEFDKAKDPQPSLFKASEPPIRKPVPDPVPVPREELLATIASWAEPFAPEELT